MSSKRIIINTVASYGNSIVALFLALFSTRWVLQALGQVDFGLYGVIGSLIALISFMSSTLSIGVARFYAYSIGEGHVLPKEESKENLKRWFNTALSMHILLPLFLIVIGLPLGEYGIVNWLTIPVERLNACFWVFRTSLISIFFTIISVPFVAMFTAYQRIFELAVFGILRTFAVFTLAWFLLNAASDRLIVYATWMMAINIGITFFQITRAVYRFEACRVQFNYMYNFEYIKRLFRYVGWKFFGMTCHTLRMQGTPFLINLHFGSVVNAAYSLSYSLSIQATSLSTAMTQAFQPAIVSAEGSGDREKMLSMTMQSCRFGSLLVLLFVIPLILEMETILKLWLKSPPQYTGILCQWMLSMLVIDRMTNGYMVAVNAMGKIAGYEFIQGLVLFLALPLIWLLFQAGMGPVSVGYALFVTMIIYCFGRVLFAKILLGFSILQWWRQVFFPVIFLVVLSSTVGYLGKSSFNAGSLSVIITSLSSGVVTFVVGWFFLFNQNERAYTLRNCIKMIQNLFINGN